MKNSREYVEPGHRLDHALVSDVIKADFAELLDVELLELLLGSFAAPETGQKLAQQCQRLFGPLRNLLAASTDALERVGLSSEMILSIKIIAALSKRMTLRSAETLIVDRSQFSIN